MPKIKKLKVERERKSKERMPKKLIKVEREWRTKGKDTKEFNQG